MSVVGAGEVMEVSMLNEVPPLQMVHREGEEGEGS